MTENKSEQYITIKMAKKMHPDKTIWEKLGFVFTETNHDDILYTTTLPLGWTIQTEENSPWTYIIDDLGNTRGNMYYQTSLYERQARMNLYCKYKVFPSYINGDYSKRYIIFGNDEETLFVAGHIYGVISPTEEQIKRSYEEEKKLIELATEWANENYPDWQNVDAYWTPNDKTFKRRTKKQ